MKRTHTSGLTRGFLAAALLVTTGAFALAPQAHADGDDLGAAVLGFTLGAVMGPPAVVYQAPAPRVYYYSYRSRGYYGRPGRWEYRHWDHRHWRHHERERDWRHHERRDRDWGHRGERRHH